MGMTTLRALLSEAFDRAGDSWSNVRYIAWGEHPYPKDRGDYDGPELDREFWSGYGLKAATPFFLWTNKRVYFLVDYDGSEEICSVSRWPTVSATPDHFGDGG